MSTVDHIFLLTGLTPPETAHRLATALGLDYGSNTQIVGGTIPGTHVFAGGRVTENYLGNEPGEPSIIDHYDVIWEIYTSSNDPEDVHSESLRLFGLVAEKLTWPALLYQDLAWLVAVWSPTNGRHDFSERVSPHSEDQHIWEPYTPQRW